MYRTIDTLIEHTTGLYNELPAFSLKTGFRTKVYTFNEVFSYIRRFPEFFAKHEIKKGDKIIVFSLNRPEYATLIFGAIWSQITLVPIDYRTNKETVHNFIEKTKPKAVFTSRVFENLFKHLPVKQFYFEELFQEIEPFEPLKHQVIDPDDTVAILFTSGTTGEPKGTIISYKNVIASVDNARQVFPLPKQLRILSILPLSHALEMFGGMMTAYSFGCHIHYIERINSFTIVQALKRYQIQAMAVVPQMLRLVLQNIDRRVTDEKKEKEWKKAQKMAPYSPFFLRRKLFKSVHNSLGGKFEFFVCGSAPLETKVATIWENMGVRIIEGYGASETTGFVSSNNFKQNKLGSVGKLFPNMELKLSDGGEIWVKGDNVVSGYYKNPEQTTLAFVNGWFKTGDIVSIDEKDFITITGRDKFKIVLPDGKKVYPEDVEKKLNNHPLVIDSTVFGLNTDGGEIVHAELILKNPDELNHIIEKVNKTLNPHEQILDFGVFPEKDFPRTKTLKVDRDAVKEIVLARLSKKVVDKKEYSQDNDAIIKILRTVSGKQDINMHGNTELATDLKLDSLKRIELLALIEEELGVSVSEVNITPQTTISDLRVLIKNGKPMVISDGIQLSEWQLSNFMRNLRLILQNIIAFPLANIVAKLTVVHPENIKLIKTPQLFIFNHVGVYDVLHDLRVLPAEIRKKTAIAATSDFWNRKHAWRGWFVSTFGNCFPFIRIEEGNNAMRGNFERVGEILDKGYNIFISPEGNISLTGDLLPFHTGAGYIAIEMGVPVTLFKLNGYYELWPEDKKRKLNLFWPKKFGKAQVVVSEPVTFSPGTSYEEATKILHEKMLSLK